MFLLTGNGTCRRKGLKSRTFEYRDVISVVILVFLSFGCSRSTDVSKVQCSKIIAHEITNTLKLNWPVGLTNVANAASYSYSTITEGSHTTIYLEMLDENSSSVSNLIGMLSASQITLAGHKPTGSPQARNYADWWRLEDYGQGQVFEVSTQQANTLTILTGFIPSAPATQKLFLHLRVMRK